MFSAFISMTVVATFILIIGKGNGQPNIIDISQTPNLFGVCVYSFMCHHSLPALVTPISKKKSLYKFLFADYALILLFYCLLAFTGIFAFARIEDIYTLNFQSKK